MSSSLKKISGIDFEASVVIVTDPPASSTTSSSSHSQSPDPSWSGHSPSTPAPSAHCSAGSVVFGPFSGLGFNSSLYLLSGLGGDAPGTNSLYEFGGGYGGFWSNSSANSGSYSGGGGASSSSTAASSNTSAAQQAAANQQAAATTTQQWSTGSATGASGSLPDPGAVASSEIIALAGARPQWVSTLHSIVSILAAERGYSPAEVSMLASCLSDGARIAIQAVVGEPIFLIEHYRDNGSYPEDVVGIGVVSVDFVFKRCAEVARVIMRGLFERTDTDTGRIFDLLKAAHDSWLAWYEKAKLEPTIVIADLYEPGKIHSASYIKEIQGEPGENNFTMKGVSEWYKAHPISFSLLNSPAHTSLLSNLPSYIATEASMFTPQL